MNTFTRVKLILAGLAALGAAVSPHAHADADSDNAMTYVADLATAGVPAGTPAQEARVGQLICGNLAGGFTTTAIALRLINIAGASRDEAIAIVGLAVIDMCPQYAPVPIVPSPIDHTPLAPAPTDDPGHFTLASVIIGPAFL